MRKLLATIVLSLTLGAGASPGNLGLAGEVSSPSSTLHTLAWRTPNVMTLLPIHTIPLTNEVHLFC